MAAGLFGYLGYDMVRLVERLPDVNPDPLGLPDAVMLRPSVVRGDGRGQGRGHGDQPGLGRPRASSARAAYAQAAERVMDAVRDLDRTPGRRRARPRRRRAVGEPVSNTAARATTSRWSRRPRTTSAPATSSRWCRASAGAADFDLPPFALYRALRRTNPRPTCSTSTSAASRWSAPAPRSWCGVKDGTVTIRPIAGTRPRGATPAEDAALEAELLADPKERAEHLMLLDLGRNDVGRVARDRHGRSRTSSSSSSATATSCTSSRTSTARSPTGRTRSRRCSPACRPARSPARPRSGRCRSSTSSRPRSAASTAAASAISPPAATWTSASRCAPRVVKDGALYVQAGGGVVYDSDPRGRVRGDRQQVQGAGAGRPRRRPVRRRRAAATDARERCRGGHGARNVRDIPVSRNSKRINEE